MVEIEITRGNQACREKVSFKLGKKIKEEERSLHLLENAARRKCIISKKDNRGIYQIELADGVKSPIWVH